MKFYPVVLILCLLAACHNKIIPFSESEVSIVTLNEESKKTFLDLGFHSLLTKEEFINNLNDTIINLKYFVILENADFSFATTDHSVRGSDILDLFKLTAKKMKFEPEYYTFEDIMGYDRFIAVWHDDRGFRLVKLNINNDNHSISWHVTHSYIRIEYDSRYKDLGLKRKNKEEFYDAVNRSFKRDKTIWPHLELYETTASISKEGELFGLKPEVLDQIWSKND